VSWHDDDLREFADWPERADAADAPAVIDRRA